MIIWDIVSLNTPIIMGRGNPREFKITTFLPLQPKVAGVKSKVPEGQGTDLTPTILDCRGYFFLFIYA